MTLSNEDEKILDHFWNLRAFKMDDIFARFSPGEAEGSSMYECYVKGQKRQALRVSLDSQGKILEIVSNIYLPKNTPSNRWLELIHAFKERIEPEFELSLTKYGAGAYPSKARRYNKETAAGFEKDWDYQW